MTAATVFSPVVPKLTRAVCGERKGQFPNGSYAIQQPSGGSPVPSLGGPLALELKEFPALEMMARASVRRGRPQLHLTTTLLPTQAQVPLNPMLLLYP